MGRMVLIVAIVVLVYAPFAARADYNAGLAAFDRGDYVGALREWRAAADAGDQESQYAVGVLYDEGYGMPADDGEAARWYRRAAEQNQINAQFVLGLFYDEGIGVPLDDMLAARWYRRAGEQGHVVALYNLGIMYATGEGVREDDVQAYRFFWLSAQLGDADARMRLRELEVWMNDQQVSQAMQLAARSPAAVLIDDSAGEAFNIGYDAYERGDYSAAFRAWRPLAEAGNAEAQFNLGYMYYYGEGVPVDDTQAARWYLQAAEQGHVTAQFNLGVMYAFGEGVAEDTAEAAYWYRQAAEQDHTRAQYNLAYMYDEGIGMAIDDVQAVMWYRRAAEQGDPDAQLNLGYMYDSGEGGSVDYAEALYWYHLAADQGLAIAQYKLGVMYRDGAGVMSDYTEAIAWFELAADQGYMDALFNLGVMHETGQGTRTDLVVAFVYYALAADTGDEEAAGVAEELAVDLSDADFVLAQEIYDAWSEDIGAAAPAVAVAESGPTTRGNVLVATGTGFIVTSSGIVMTNHHVTEGCADMHITGEGLNSVPALVIADNPVDDLALIKMPQGSDAVAMFRGGSAVRPGDDVVVIGYPYHGLLSSEVKVTTGTISAASGIGDDPREFQLTAPVQPGNSGGPMLDMSANIAGVVVAKLDALMIAEEMDDIPQNINFAIKSRVAVDFLDAEDINYTIAAPGPPMGAADVADIARAFTVLVECWN
jgi:TPR repeat protein